MTSVMSPVHHRDPLFRGREPATKVYSPSFKAVNGQASPQQAVPPNRLKGSNTSNSDAPQRIESRPETAHSTNNSRPQDRPRDIDSRAIQRADTLRTSPGQSSPLRSPAKRKRISSDVDAEGSTRMVLLPSSRTGTNTSNTTTNTAVTAHGSPPKRFDDVDPLGPEGEQAEQSQDEDQESMDENERDSNGLEYDMQDRSWNGRDERERYKPYRGADEQVDHQGGQLSRTTTTTTMNGQDPNMVSDLARRDTEVSEVTAAGVQVLNPKKRKRVFSNRTKTGCQTCRKRKKKCDEQKPECGNCIRGSFVCEGYITKATWTKPSSTKAPVRLQSKNGYAETSPTYHGGTSPRDQYDPAQGVRQRLVPAEEPPHSSGWQKRPTWSEPQHPHYASEPPPRGDFSRAATIPDVSRHDQRMQDYPPVPHHRASHPYHTSPPQSINTSQPAVTAQLALQYQNGHRPNSSLSGPPQPGPAAAQPMSEKEKMLHGYLYQPYCPELEEDRDVCNANVWRFNEVNNPMKLISKAEREIKFRAILETGMSRNLIGQPGSGNNGNNRLGRDVRVEAPFACEFGYNIDVHDDVVIGRNCSIMDAARVVLRAGAFLHPNVSIFTAYMSTNPNRRDPRQRGFQGRPVTIGENVVIGSNVVINPGVTIGKNTTVYAGSVVEDDIPSDVVAAGNPARILGAVPDSPAAPQPRMTERYPHPQHHAAPPPSGPSTAPPMSASHHGHHGSHGSHSGYLPDAYGPPPPQAGPPPHTPSHIPHQHQHQHQHQHSGPPPSHPPVSSPYARSSIGSMETGGYVPAEQHQHGHPHHQQPHQYAHYEHQPQHSSQYHDDANGGSGPGNGHGPGGGRYYEGQSKGLRPVHPRPPARA